MAPHCLPDPDRIVLEAPPPDSPSFQALKCLPCPDPEQEISAVFLVPSPQKKTRSYQPSLKKKRTYPATITGQSVANRENSADLGVIPSTVDEWEADTLPDGDTVVGYQEYVHAVTSDIAGLYRIEKTIFVAQGWDLKAMSATVCTIATVTLLDVKYIPLVILVSPSTSYNSTQECRCC